MSDPRFPHPSDPGPVDEAHAFALLIWAQQEALAAEGGLLLPFSAAVTRRHTDELALERANLLRRRSDVPQEGH